jgi:hypothetical protein
VQKCLFISMQAIADTLEDSAFGNGNAPFQ